MLKTCPIKFDSLEWKENPYGKTTWLFVKPKIDPESVEPSMIKEMLYFPMIWFESCDCKLIKK